MYFAFFCQDKPGALQLRLDTRPAHVEFLERLNVEGRLGFAGPLLDGEGKPNGTLAVVRAENIEDARSLSAADPYAKAGLFASVDIRPWNWVFNQPES